MKKSQVPEAIKIKPVKIQAGSFMKRRNIITAFMVCYNGTKQRLTVCDFFAGRAVDKPSDALQMTEFLTHCLALDKHNSSPQQSSSGTPGKTNESLR